MNIFLIGPMATGKSHIGQTLAKQLKCQFYDTDDLICQRAAMDIAAIFEKEGEAGFRMRESKVVRELVKNRNMVVATGGGVILDEKNCKALSKNGTVIYLNTALDTRCQRMQNPAGRPLLMKGDAYQAMQDLDSVRTPIYEAVADCVVDNNGDAALTVASIMEYINKTKGT